VEIDKELWDHLTKLGSQLEQQQSSWLGPWSDAAELLAPRSFRHDVGDTNKGTKVNQEIIDNDPRRAAQIMAAGMMSGITSPSRPWFQLSTPDPDLAQWGDVREWLDEVTRRMRSLFLRSNLYGALPKTYMDLGVFGTHSLLQASDHDDVFRFYHEPVGSYQLACDGRRQVNTRRRCFSMTAAQMAERYGKDNLSSQAQRDLAENAGQSRYTVVHIIEPNPDARPGPQPGKFKPFRSVHYETGADDCKVLRLSGYDSFPILAPRWGTVGEDVYGTGHPGEVSLEDVRGLQELQLVKADAREMQVNPPLNVPYGMDDASILPGAMNRHPDGIGGITSAFQVNLDIRGAMEDVMEHKERINKAFYVDLFLMMANESRSNVTATEIAERHEEKLLMLGPVLESLNDEFLDPLIDRSFALMEERDLIPPAPEALQGVELKVEYTSIMAQAQKMAGLAAMERGYAFIASQAEAKPEVLDKWDADEAADQYADMIGLPAKVIRSDDDVADIRARRAQAEQQAAEMEAAQATAGMARDLGQTPIDDGTALNALMQATGVSA
jgi:hypothetical protein